MVEHTPSPAKLSLLLLGICFKLFGPDFCLNVYVYLYMKH